MSDISHSPPISPRALRVTVLAAGSRGDIQPYLSLALALRRAGHQVLFAANVNFTNLAAAYDLPFHPLGVDSYAFVQSGGAQAWLEAGSPLRLAWTSFRYVRPTFDRLLADAWAACREAEAIVYHTFTLPAAYYMGLDLGLPCFPASMYPLATGAHPALPLNIPNRFGRPFNRLTHLIVDQFTWLAYRASAARFFRGRLNIAWSHPNRLLYSERRPLACGYSPSVLPVPDDLPDHVHVTGYWFLDPPPAWQPDPALVRFLAADPPPFYVGFGSMGNPARALETTAIFLEALERTGQRGLLAAGWSGLGQDYKLPASVFVVKDVPHTWLLPKMAAVIHHGGVGTTGAGLRAGVPNIVVPHFADQFFWGRRIADLHAGPRPLPRQDLTVEKLAGAIRQAVDDQALRDRAAALGRAIRAETGLESTVALFEQYVSEERGT